MKPDQLVQVAREARDRAYAPYSRYRVGAALLTRDGIVVSGCNVENASFGLTCCAERAAVFAAVATGHRKFTALAVVTDDAAAPCGACRQVLREFAPDLAVHVASVDGSYRTRRLGDLLPESFGPDSVRPSAS